MPINYLRNDPDPELVILDDNFGPGLPLQSESLCKKSAKKAFSKLVIGKLLNELKINIYKRNREMPAL